MEGPSKLHSLEESLKFAADAYRKAAKVAGDRGQSMPMSQEDWLNQARERHKVLSNMNEEQFDVAMAEMHQEQMPALLATREFLDQFIGALKSGKGKKFASKIVKHAHDVAKEAKKVSKEQR